MKISYRRWLENCAWKKLVFNDREFSITQEYLKVKMLYKHNVFIIMLINYTLNRWIKQGNKLNI